MSVTFFSTKFWFLIHGQSFPYVATSLFYSLVLLLSRQKSRFSTLELVRIKQTRISNAVCLKCLIHEHVEIHVNILLEISFLIWILIALFKGRFFVGYLIPRRKSPSPKNPGDKKPQSPGILQIKILRFSKIPNSRDKNPQSLKIPNPQG